MALDSLSKLNIAQTTLSAYIILLLTTKRFDPTLHVNQDAIVDAVPEAGDRDTADWKGILDALVWAKPRSNSLVFSTAYNTPFMQALKETPFRDSIKRVDGQLHLFDDGDIVVRYPVGTHGNYQDFPIAYKEQRGGPKADYARGAAVPDAALQSLGFVDVARQSPRFVENPDGRSTDYGDWDAATDTFVTKRGDWVLDAAAPIETFQLEIQKIHRNKPFREIRSSQTIEEPAGSFFVLLNPNGGQRGLPGQRTLFKTREELLLFLNELRDYATDPADPHFQANPEDAYRITGVTRCAALERVNATPASEVASPTAERPRAIRRTLQAIRRLRS